MQPCHLILLCDLCVLCGQFSFCFSRAVDGAHAGHGFVDGLLVFAFGSRVGDDAAARLDIRFAVLEQHCSQRDAGVVVAVEAEVADGAGVGAAFAFFEFVEDLHGADFRRSGDGSGGECGAHDIEGAAASGEFSRDMRDDVHDMAVALDRHEIGDFHGAVFRDAAIVEVASQLSRILVLLIFRLECTNTNAVFFR